MDTVFQIAGDHCVWTNLFMQADTGWGENCKQEQKYLLPLNCVQNKSQAVKRTRTNAFIWALLHHFLHVNTGQDRNFGAFHKITFTTYSYLNLCTAMQWFGYGVCQHCHPAPFQAPPCFYHSSPTPFHPPPLPMLLLTCSCGRLQGTPGAVPSLWSSCQHP